MLYLGFNFTWKHPSLQAIISNSLNQITSLESYQSKVILMPFNHSNYQNQPISVIDQKLID
jgi:hypothetical protein